MKKTIAFFCFSLFLLHVKAQELNIRVQVTAPKVANMSQNNIEQVQTVIRNALNNNKWTNENYQPQERIEANLVITITAWDGNSAYTADAQVQSSRPVFATAYQTTLLNYNDKDFDFNYTEGQPVDLSDQNYLGNLSALVSYYAYTLIGLDKDSFSQLGGTPYYQKARQVLNLAQNSGNTGWKASDGLRNRYWLNANLLDNSMEELRAFIYNYHVNTLDRMQENPRAAAQSLIGYLSALQQMDRQKLGAIFPNVYLAAKAEEMTNILATADPLDKTKAYNLLSNIDPANISRYQVLKNN